MDCYLMYYPYKSHKYAIPMTVGLCVLGFIEACFFANKHIFLAIITLLLFTVLLICTKFLYDTANKVVIFNSDGLTITDSKHKKHQFFPWNDFQYAYYSRNYKGHRFLLLSPRILSYSQIKAGVREGEKGKCIYQNDIAVIHLMFKQEVSTIESMIASKNLQISKTD